jgi:rhodanese-related sulfurtransferase
MSLFSSLFKASGSTVRRVTPAEAAHLVADGKAVLVDVREADEWADGRRRARRAARIERPHRPAPDVGNRFLEKNRDKELILYCRSGGRSGRAAQLLAAEGYRTANAGGFNDWARADLPTRRA